LLRCLRELAHPNNPRRNYNQAASGAATSVPLLFIDEKMPLTL
jgi:hypothetical protein